MAKRAMLINLARYRKCDYVDLIYKSNIGFMERISQAPAFHIGIHACPDEKHTYKLWPVTERRLSIFKTSPPSPIGR